MSHVCDVFIHIYICDAVDGSEIQRENQLQVGSEYPIIYRVLVYIPGGWPWDC